MSSVPTISEISPELFYDDKVTKLENGMNVVYISKVHRGGKDDRFRFQMCTDRHDFKSEDSLVETPFGYKPNPMNLGEKKATIALECPQEVLSFLDKLDDCNKDYASSNCEKLFKKAMTESQLSEHYVSLVRLPAEDKAGKYPPLVNVKVALEGKDATVIDIYKGHEWKDGKLEIFKETGTVHDITPKCKMAVVCKITSLWLKWPQWGASVAAESILLFPKAETARGIDAFGFDATITKVADEE